MANSRPIHTFYLSRTVRAATPTHHDRAGRATTVEAALVAATRRVVKKDFARCDIYGVSGHHLYTVKRVQHGIMIVHGRRGHSWNTF